MGQLCPPVSLSPLEMWPLSPASRGSEECLAKSCFTDFWPLEATQSVVTTVTATSSFCGQGCLLGTALGAWPLLDTNT